AEDGTRHDLVTGVQTCALPILRLAGASDPDGNSVSTEITGVTQDEPVGGSRDAFGAADNLVRLRAERDPRGDGRVYQVGFTATRTGERRGGKGGGVVYGHAVVE